MGVLDLKGLFTPHRDSSSQLLAAEESTGGVPPLPPPLLPLAAMPNDTDLFRRGIG